ncbi:MAG: FHA domain-containing protein, partial [Thermoleophilaceae bacterium]
GNGGATLGRSSSADIEVDDPFASSAHARIFPRGDFMYIEDVGSTNGTYLNGRQLRQPEQLKPADSVRIGDTEYRYRE